MYIERTIFKTLLDHQNNKKITILIGARQVGKTTLLNELYRVLKSDHPCLFMDLDLYADYEKVSTYEHLINTLRLNGYTESQENLFFLFLDEFQRYADVGNVIKNIADHHLNIKVYASGSSSLGINSNIQESLAGRKRVVQIYPLNFVEYLKFQNQSQLIRKLKNLSEIRSDAIQKIIPEIYPHLESFMIFGGYPEVALTRPHEREEVFNSIFDLYVKKDLVDYLNVEKIRNAKLLIQRLAVNNGCETRYNELGQITGLNDKTIKNYIEILKETFLISVHPPWFTNRNKEIVKMPKIYFLDNGVRNFFINNFSELKLRVDAPFLFEGYVISELIKKGISPKSIKFWRTKNRIEIDMIIERGGRQIPVEIKYKPKLMPKDLKGFKSYLTQYPHTENAYLVNLNNNTTQNGIRLLSPFDLDVLLA